MTAWDAALARRTGALALLLLLLATAVLVATDERDATLQTRLSRLCALAPALAALAIVAITKRLDASGDLRALAAMGVTRERALLGAIALATALGLLGALALVLGWGSLDGLFPPPSGELWARRDRGFTAPGLSLDGIDGAVTFLPTASSRAVPAASRTMVGAAIALFALGLPWWVTHRERGAVRVLVGLSLVLGAIVCFHAVSAGHPSALLLAPPAALLAYLVALALRSRTHELRDPG